MRRHELDLTSLLAGLVLLAFAGAYLLGQASGHPIDARWTLPLVLVALGLVGLASGVARALSRTGAAPSAESGGHDHAAGEGVGTVET